jgi:hypothetical protein
MNRHRQLDCPRHWPDDDVTVVASARQPRRLCSRKTGHRVVLRKRSQQNRPNEIRQGRPWRLHPVQNVIAGVAITAAGTTNSKVIILQDDLPRAQNDLSP